MKIVPVIFIIIIYSLINFYVAFRGWQVLPNIKAVKISYVVLMIFLAYGYIAGMIFRNHLPAGVEKFIEIVGSTWLIALIYLFLAVVLMDLIRLLNHWLHFLPEITIQVRQIAMLSVLGVVAIVFSIGYYRFNHPVLSEIDIMVKNEHAAKDELKIAVASDLHLGSILGKKHAQRYVDEINKLQPDLILFVGDVVNADLRPLMQQRMYEELSQLKAPFGVYAVFGNHEYISGNIAGTLDFFKTSHINLLRDDFVKIDDMLLLVGRDDRSNPERLPLKTLLEKTDNEQQLPVIMMDHQPYRLDEAEQNNIALMLSGHTHAGQIWPISWIVDSMYEIAHGYKQKGNSHFYVSSGLGIWGPPFRIGTHSELVLIRMRFER